MPTRNLTTNQNKSAKALYENGHRDIISKINFTECSLCGVKLKEKGI